MESYGYRFDTPDRSIVISGDTNPTQATINACRGCDVLIHEVHTPAWLATRPETFQQFAAKYHTTTPQLAELARQAKPKLLILYHYSGFRAKSCSTICSPVIRDTSLSVETSMSTELRLNRGIHWYRKRASVYRFNFTCLISR